MSQPRTLTVIGGPNKGDIIYIEQEYLFRGTNFNKFEEQLKKNKGLYCGCNDEEYGLSTLVASNIDGAVIYCPSNYTESHRKPLLLAIRHEHYELKTPHSAEGLAIKGLISLDDILQITTEEILLKAYPNFHSLSEEVQKKVKLGAGILD